MRLDEISDDTDLPSLIEIGPKWTVERDGSVHELQIRDEETSVLRPIAQVQVVGTFQIRVSDVALEHRRLGEVVYGSGEGTIGGEEALVVLTEGPQAKLTVKFRSDPERTMRYDEL